MSRIWVNTWQDDDGDDVRYLRGEEITAVTRCKVEDDDYRVQVTLAHPDQHGLRTVDLWDLPDIVTASNAAGDLIAALAGDHDGIVTIGGEDQGYQVAVVDFGNRPPYVGPAE